MVRKYNAQDRKKGENKQTVPTAKENFGAKRGEKKKGAQIC